MTEERQGALGGQRALVTGASSGIGAAIAKGLASAGAAVAVNYSHDEAGAARTVSQIEAGGGRAFAIRAREAAREFLRRGKTSASKALGKIICVSSVHDVIPWAGHANYAASKGGVSMLMKTMAQELAQHGIRVGATLYVDGGMTLFPEFRFGG